MEYINQQIKTADNIILYSEVASVVLIIICAIFLFKTYKIKLPK